MSDLEELKARAKAATAGPWEAVESAGVVMCAGRTIAQCYWVSGSDQSIDSNAAYIATFSPDVAEALIEEIERLRWEREDLSENLRDLVMLEAERDAVRGGGPGWADRYEKAMARAQERFLP